MAFTPGNPTDPFPPNQPVSPTDKPTFPGNPTDPFPTPPSPPPPTHPTFPGNPTDPFPPTLTPAPSRPQALLSQVETQGAALDAGLRSVLDTLATTVGTTAQQSKAALDQVTNALRNQLKTTSGQQMEAINAVVGQIVNAANSNATISQTALDSIVNTLAAAPPPPVLPPLPPGYINVSSHEVAAFQAEGFKCYLVDAASGAYFCTQNPALPPPLTPTPTPVQPPTLSPSPTPIQPPQPVQQPPQAVCNTCTITNAVGQWVQTFNNLSPTQVNSLIAQVSKTPGYHIACQPMANQNCTPPIFDPVWTPPGTLAPIGPGVNPAPVAGPVGGGGGGGGGVPIVPIGTPILVGGGGGGGGIAPTLSPTGGGGAPTLSPTGGGGGAPTLSPTGGGGAPTLSPTGGGSPTLTPTGGGSPTLSPTGSPIPPTLSPTGFPPYVPPPGGNAPQYKCTIPQPPNFGINQAHTIGSAAWCAAIDKLRSDLGVVGAFLMQLPAIADPGTFHLPDNLADQIMSIFGGPTSTLPGTPSATSLIGEFIAVAPFGFGQALQYIWSNIACAWNAISDEIRALVVSGYRVVNAITCGEPAVTIGLIVVRGAIQALKRFRVGTDAGLWATVDLSVTWTQAERALDYLVDYSCPSIIPDANETLALYRGGWISLDIYNCWLKMTGRDPAIWSPVLEHGRPRPGLNERQRMLWRLRPDDNDLGQSFNDAQYEASLLQDGYNEHWTSLLDAIKYNAYTLREIRELLDSGVIGHDETLAAFKDMGFDPAKAEVLAQMELTLTKRRRESEIVGLTPARISSLYARGKFTESDVSLYMQALSFSEQQAERLRQTARYDNDAAAADHFLKAAISEGTAALRDAYTTGTVADADAVKNLMALGAPQTTATALVQVWAAMITTKNAKTGIAALKRGWDSGYMGGAAALINLEHTGLTNANATATLAQWGLERAANEHLLTVQQILAQVATGQTSAIDAAARLHNMGWYADDANILIANAESKLAASIAKQAESAAKAMAAAEKSAATQSAKDAASKAKASIQAAKATEQLAKHAEAAMRLGEQQLKRITPVSTLRSWLKEGYISAAAFQSRMVLMGNPPEVAQLMADEICNKKGAACVNQDGPADNVLTDSASAGGAGI